MNLTIIRAVPGAGKTTYIVNEIIRDLASGTKAKRICATTFSNAAADELRRRVGSKDVAIHTLCSLAGTIVARKKKSLGKMTYSQTLLEAAQLVDGMQKNLFDVVYIDEAQDLDYYQFMFARSLVNKCDRALVVGDPMQSIYEFGNSDSGYMFRLADNFSEMQMLDTHRLSKAVTDFVMSITRYPIRTTRSTTGSVLLVDSISETVAKLRQKRQSTVGVIFRTNHEVLEFVKQLSDKGVPCNYQISGFTTPVATTVMKLLLDDGISDWELFKTVLTASSVVSQRTINQLKGVLTFGEPTTRKLLEKLGTEIGPNITSEARVAITAMLRLLDSIDDNARKSIEERVDNVYMQASEIMDQTAVDREAAVSAALEYIKNGTRPVIRVSKGSKLTVLTAHASKGLEFDRVVLSLERFDVYDDLKVFYVATTRARDELYLYVPDCARERSQWNLIDAVLNEFGYI